MNLFPKVLIIGETFYRSSGGGITLSNLFADFPKQNLAVVANHMIISKSSDEICDNYYSLGNENFKYVFPLNIIYNTKSSGRYRIRKNNVDNLNTDNKQSVIKSYIKSHLKSFFQKTGLIYYSNKYKITNSLIGWIEDFNPDIIYTQLGNYSMIKFVYDISKITRKPIVIHIMDDWITTSTSGIFSFIFRSKMLKRFNNILNYSSLNLCISEGMKNEYEKRYNTTFLPFHNPVDIDFWSSSQKKEFHINNKCVKIMYSGKIGLGKNKSIYEIAEVIEAINKEGIYNIEYQIQSTNITKHEKQKLSKFKCVVINSIVDYDILPKVYGNVDILVIPMDFSRSGKKYLRYSMLTKASEFMISGTPIFLYAPEEMSMCKDAKKNNWAYVVSKDSKIALKEGLLYFISSIDERMRVSLKAIEHSKANFSTNKIREEFKSELIKIIS